LIKSTTFQDQGPGGYDKDAIDWFLEELLRREDQPAPDGMSADPWRDLPVVNQFSQSRLSGLTERSAQRSWRARWKDRSGDREYISEECVSAWRGFGQLPGVHLELAYVGRRRSELRGADQQVIAFHHNHWSESITVSMGGRSFTLKMPGRGQSWSAGMDEIAARSYRDDEGHFAASRKQRSAKTQRALAGLKELADEMGTPILYTSGENFRYRATACISFPDQRWLRFLVRGTNRANAIMTAVDEAGNRVARYRLTSRRETQITVNPGWVLTEGVLLVITISADWLSSYFDTTTE
jgi:hypothetical protein